MKDHYDLGREPAGPMLRADMEPVLLEKRVESMP